MKRLYNLSIRKKFAVVIIPLLIIILCFDFLQLQHKYYDYDDATRLNAAILLGNEINHVVHELQKERSITAGYLSDVAHLFHEKLEAQREISDRSISQFQAELGTDTYDDVRELHKDDLERLQAYFDKIESQRRQVDALHSSANQAIRFYSNVNDVALNTVNSLILETRDKEIAEQVHAIVYFLKSKERASIERAIGTRAFSNDVIDTESFGQFSTLVAEQESFLDAFLTIASPDFKRDYENTIRGPDMEEMERMRQTLYQNEKLDEDPNEWYRVCTSRIDALKQVEDKMTKSVAEKTSQIAGDTYQSFLLFVALDLLIGGLAFFLMSKIVSNLLENVSRLDAFTRRITSGDLSQKVNIETKDEIGHYAKTFNVMVEEIGKSRKELEKQRDRAKFLYRNIYHVAKVVFENIDQGIFLLDRKFKISSFHSNATAKIFDAHHVSGENFTSFMRPLILPRELEALEMFMRHLFNNDMDEDVVNQLNPVEQVKIYTESDGSVATKFVKIHFTRIVRKGVIQNIMVTVSDETEAILLQQHLEEAERKKKQESEQVLSVLKIDPSVLRGFIHNTKKTLQSISERYEKNDGDDYGQLLDHTFQTVHSLKSNAVIIGLKIMSVKFHEIEETITKLKERQIRAKDFLTVLYEIDEADNMLDDMEELLRKIANIYKNLPSEGHVANNIMVIDSLGKGVETISKDLGKQADFNFKNEKNIVIPEDLINPFNDIMTQLIRNSLAHGIEKPDDRKHLGKPEKGVISIELDQSNSGELIINYKDDGCGLDSNKIRSQAVTRSILTATEAKKLKDEDIISLIFKEGFSVSEEVDHNSGRGQGMNLIKSIVEEFDGNYELNFDPGNFFQMMIKLPKQDKKTEPA